MLPVPRLARQSFLFVPSVFHFHYSDRFFAGICWFGAAMSAGSSPVSPTWCRCGRR